MKRRKVEALRLQVGRKRALVLIVPMLSRGITCLVVINGVAEIPAEPMVANLFRVHAALVRLWWTIGHDIFDDSQKIAVAHGG
ncbi:MAG TPA: hypothetical protein EYO05_06470 [Gammaproteobacteria bacterium]|jgi:hypothetical protein|nr:hypothetical protein [Gammaproteobacteria bacterium]